MTTNQEIKSLFYGDIREKKSAGHSARRKRNGSRTAYVSLPSDHMTQKELKKMNGEVKSYNLSKPMAFQEFREMPADLRRQYLAFLVHTYGATMGAIANAFSVSVDTLRRAMDGCDGSDLFRRGARMTARQELDLTQFFHPERCTAPLQEKFPAAKATPLSVEEFTIQFHGPFDADHVVNTLRSMVPAGQPVTVRIACRWEEESI